MFAIMGLVSSIYVLLIAGWCMLVGTAPLLAVVFLVRDLSYYPLYILAALLSAPGLAAMFAVFRDQPSLASWDAALRQRLVTDRMQGWQLPDWIASPYVHPDASGALIRPYFKAWWKLALRSWLIALPFALAAFACLYDAQIAGVFGLRFASIARGYSDFDSACSSLSHCPDSCGGISQGPLVADS
ncbi:hypothetical protein KIMH_13110 [Bombiscardovia apis]|uniref:Uncharacterized protein n=2 Tax=Bombiscardovia apis TaxID=2932182 RepID=A0ABN6SGS1_9BIFI|nr:hypothetical protein KIMH_13110 [Bombiscardovia apis]